jgi:hypothetical protein
MLKRGPIICSSLQPGQICLFTKLREHFVWLKIKVIIWVKLKDHNKLWEDVDQPLFLSVSSYKLSSSNFSC